MDIGTAKVTAADRAKVPHHGLDLVDPDEPFSLADYAASAETALQQIAGRGGLAILVGGTGLYLRGVARGVDLNGLPADPDVRARLEADLERDGVAALAARLAREAPGLAASTDVRNPRRLVRALEIAALAGDVDRPAPRGYAGRSGWLGLRAEPATHRRWIADRAAGQFDGGLLEEAAILREHHPTDLRAFSAIGYPEAFGVLDGRLSRDEALTETVRRTVAFAKRQRTWFRAEPGIDWLASEEDPLPAALMTARRLLETPR
jgi:tRNA dimethylallyltransferase